METIQTTQAIAKATTCSSQTNDKTLLLKTIPIQFIENRIQTGAYIETSLLWTNVHDTGGYSSRYQRRRVNTKPIYKLFCLQW